MHGLAKMQNHFRRQDKGQGDRGIGNAQQFGQGFDIGEGRDGFLATHHANRDDRGVIFHGKMHETVAKAHQFIAIFIELAGTANSFREHNDRFFSLQHFGAVDRVAQHRTNLIQPVAQIRNGREEPLDHGARQAGFLFSGGNGVADQNAVQR